VLVSIAASAQSPTLTWTSEASDIWNRLVEFTAIFSWLTPRSAFSGGASFEGFFLALRGPNLD
jgi:hypothetical protein